MKIKEPRFVLIEDDDGHWYVCRADRRFEALAYFEAMGDDSLEETPDCPEWLEAVGGSPSLVKFTGYEID